MGTTTPEEPRKILLFILVVIGTLLGVCGYLGKLDDLGRAVKSLFTLFGLLD